MARGAQSPVRMKDSIVLGRHSPPQLGLLERATRKLIALGMRAATRRRNLGRALRSLIRSSTLVGPLDHVTMPVRDLEIAEQFYVGLLGGDVVMRCDEAFFRARGVETKMHTSTGKDLSPLHLSLSFGSGPRLDLFLQSWGQPTVEQPHTHLAFRIPASKMMHWKDKLASEGIPSDGPRRLGPPGQASLYFNDPFGNHLELQTLGCDLEIPMGPPDMESLVYQWRPRIAR
jgi:catechol 2,3-dioxygenase-like lactoylglutathione lyase family enzyme